MCTFFDAAGTNYPEEMGANLGGPKTVFASGLQAARNFAGARVYKNPRRDSLRRPEDPYKSARMKKSEHQPILSAAFGAAHAPQPRDHGSSE